MTKITSIEQLIDCFEDADRSEQIGVLKKLDVSKEEFEQFATWKKGDYTRNCLARRDSFEFILLCWEVGAKTPIHGHGGQDCWVYQVSGTVLEKRFSETDKDFDLPKAITLKEGKITYMNDKMGYHSIENTSNRRAMTLHVYANPIDRCKVLNEVTNSFEVREMQYDTINEEESVFIKDHN